MDDILKVTGEKGSFRIHASAILLTVLTVILGVSVYSAMILSKETALVRNMYFYGRYNSAYVGFGARFNEVLINSVPTLAQLLILFLLSFSPLLIPSGILITVFRGIVTGVAFCRVGNSADAVQPCFYLAVSLIICIMCASFLHYREITGLSPSHRAMQKSAIFLISSGACVTAELMLSFVM